MSNTTYIDNNGYSKFKDSGKLVHQSVAEMKLGRSLKKGEAVHHKNRDKQDNSFKNLEIFSSQEKHWGVHKMDAKKHGWGYSLGGKRTNSRRSRKK
jgi:hypothetical protein